MSKFSEFIGGGRNPADAAMPYFDQIPGMLQQNYNPYIQRGTTAYGAMAPQYNQMSTDPAAFLESIMGKYEPSKGYQLKLDEGMRAAGNSAAAGGMRGSMQDIQNESRLASSLMGDDMQQWLNNVLGLHTRGLQGQQGLYNTGYDATRNMTGDMANVMGTQGSLAFQGQANKNQGQRDLFSGIQKALGAGAGMYMGGGM